MATLTLHHGDCLELMKTLPDKSIDLFVCDLPYGCLGPVKGGGPSLRDPNKPSNQRKRFVDGVDTGTMLTSGTLGGCEWDIPIDLAAFCIQVKRLCKNDHTPVLMFCTTKFGVDLINSNPDWFRYDLVWSKPNAVGFLLANKMPMRSHEMIYVFSKKGANYTRVDIRGDFVNTNKGGRGMNHLVYHDFNDTPKSSNEGKRCVKSVVEMSNKKGKGNHPTQKPDDLYEWLITRYSKEGDTILDPTAGSFASCFTAQKLGRNAIGIEKDDGFYEKAKSLAGV
jgi:site-specific DNA-methyltransferase (adenine-specific)